MIIKQEEKLKFSKDLIKPRAEDLFISIISAVLWIAMMIWLVETYIN